MTCKVSGNSKEYLISMGKKLKKIFCILGLSILEWIIKVYEELSATKWKNAEANKEKYSMSISIQETVL